MNRRALAARLQRNEVAAWSLFTSLDPALNRRYGIGSARREGVLCTSCSAFPTPLFHRAIGFGTLVAASRAALDAILRHYARLGAPARVEVPDEIAPAAARRLLERSGFTREPAIHHVHVRDRDEPPALTSVAGLRIQRVRRKDAVEFGRLVRDGFETQGDLGDLFERLTISSARRAPLDRLVSIWGSVDGARAATGLLFVAAGVGGLYSGSVLPAFRGRGIQSAMIAERLRNGWSRGIRLFTSQTGPDNPSQHNLHDLGFRLLYRSTFFVRQT